MTKTGTLDFQARRSPVLGIHAAVSTSQPLATDIGTRILRSGGNAVDAAVAISAALCVLEPCSTGLGGDMFMLYYEASTKKVHAVNGSGAAPAALTLERCLADLAKATPIPTPARTGAACAGDPPTKVHDIPPHHPHSVTVPGAAAGWCDSVSKFGSGAVSLSQLMEPAAVFAEEGFPVSPITAHHWGLGAYQLDTGPNKGAALLNPSGKAPAAGEVFRNPDMAGVLRELGAGGKEEFYSGRIGEAMVKVLREMGGVLTMEDLKAHTTAFVEPISVEFAGVRVYEVPPNGQGITALLALNILKELGVVDNDAKTAAAAAEKVAAGESGATAADGAGGAKKEGEGEAAYLHRLIEVLRLAFADTRWYCADMDKVEVPVEELLGQRYAAERARLFNPDRASADVEKGSPTKSSCTVSFQVVDDQGNAVSFVNSNYSGFGSGIVPESCGFSLQSRGSNFSLDPEHPNVLAPGKRPYHTIIPCMVTSEDTGELFATMTNMGCFMQPQGHVQLLSNLLLRGMDPQAAIDAPRFCIRDGMANGAVALEPLPLSHPKGEAREGAGAGAEEGCEVVAEELRRMGHDIRIVRGHARVEMGRAQIIQRKMSGGTQVLWCGSDGRADGCALAW